MGFVGETADGVKWVGMTCAACHTAELHVNNVAYRVDGAPTQGNVQALISDMIVAVKNTVDDPAKFDRFAAKVLASKDDPGGRDELKAKIARWVAIRSGYNMRNFPGFDPNATSPQGPLGVGRFGQLDAVGAIVNEVYWNAATVQDLKKPTAVSKTADAPVSYPFLWNAPQQDKVQWLGIAPERRPGGHLQPRPECRRGRRRLRARRDPRQDRDPEQGLSIDDRSGEPGEARRADHDALVAALARERVRRDRPQLRR